MANIAALMELGFSRRDAARALHHANGDVNKACEVSVMSSQVLIIIEQSQPLTC